MPTPAPSTATLAILIDADNARPTIIKGLIDEVAKLGRATVRRIYGDWTTTHLASWKDAALEHSIQPIQQFAYTTGKNSTDSAMIIDAMDLLSVAPRLPGNALRGIRMRHVLFGLLLVSSVAQAETWQQIGKLEAKGSVLFLDTSGIIRTGQHRKARLKLVYDADQPIPASYGGKPLDVSTYRSDLNDYDFNCAERTVALSQSILHDAENQVVGRINIPERAQTFRKAQPGTAPGKILDAVCNWGENRAQETGAPTQVTQAANPVDYYPAGSARRQEQGTPVIEVCVGRDGQLLREPVVVNTSGFPELDAAALKVAKASRYAAGTENGKPLAESCIKFKVKFVLRD
jgi:TonB family protein